MIQAVRPDVEKILAGLKPFQCRSVDYVFDRLYGTDPTHRFLLADEVGLGKTMVARGVIAKAVDHLWDKVPRIDVVYICSNGDIARQNIARLNITGQKDLAAASRITLLPLHLDGSLEQRVNFVSFTPGTSFDLKSSLGVAQERALIYRLLDWAWGLKGMAPKNVLQGAAGSGSFRWQVDRIEEGDVNMDLAHRFIVEVAHTPELRQRFDALCEQFSRTRSEARLPPELAEERNRLIGDLRAKLAKACLRSLQPDLIILDEFQRFKHLLLGDSEAAELAQYLFNYSDEHTEARVLLLSATPYKMYTMAQESAEDDHYADFLATLQFLLKSPAKAQQVERLIKDYRAHLYQIGDDDGHELQLVRNQLQDLLRQVMCRTERLAVTEDRSGMLREIAAAPRLENQDVRAYLQLQQLSRSVEQGETMEYWKSAAYPLNFMEAYKLKRHFKERCAEPQVLECVQQLAATGGGVLLPWGRFERYEAIEPQNARLRDLVSNTVDTGAWQLLWIPPSLPYYQPDGAFSAAAAGAGFTKRLVFSSWHLVPRSIATLVSYEVERRMMTLLDPTAQNTSEAREKRRPLLRFTRSDGRLTGMANLALLYPSTFLARQYDPLRYKSDQVDRILDREELVGLITHAVSEQLKDLTRNAPDTGPEDETWYWAAPILLDFTDDPDVTRQWWDSESLARDWSGEHEGEESLGWQDHVEEARRVLKGDRKLGRPPANLAQVLAQTAIASPAVAALRALGRVCGGPVTYSSPERRHRAGRVAFAFRTLFNVPEVTALIRGRDQAEPFWHRVLEYCVDGNLQSVLDEFAHVLRESEVSLDTPHDVAAEAVADAIVSAVGLRVAQPGVDRIELSATGRSVNVENQRVRTRFAMRFGDEKSEGDGNVFRADQVRKAFNSPFWPFVLVTTSIGQEGLDFHPYCHAVVHWNLPSNPVDLEQREGRVHRYKGHAVRRNLATAFGASPDLTHQSDPWRIMFDRAAAGDTSQGLRPYWVLPLDGGMVIERHVPSLPLSREADRLPALRASLAVYRMVFGQPRQDDLVAYLLSRISKEQLPKKLDEVRIDVSPLSPVS